MRALERENYQLLLGVIGIMFILLFMNPARSAGKAISCETAYGEKSFTIENKSVAFHIKKDEGRSLSSILDARTQKTHMGFRKTIYKGGLKHLINIENTKSFSDGEDFIAITNKRGHKMTYPLTCKFI